MIIIEKASRLNFRFGFGQTQDYIINELEKSFIEKHGQELFATASLIIVIENENFYHVIKNKYYPRISGELMDNLCGNIIDNLEI